MISNASTQFDIERQWSVVKRLSKDGNTMLIPGAGIVEQSFPAGFRNLSFVLAYTVIEQVLEALIDAGHVPRPKQMHIGQMMAAASTSLSWIDYGKVETGRIRRNELAHDGRLLSDSECLEYILAIEQELKLWNVIP